MKKTKSKELAKLLFISDSRGMEALVKAKLITGILKHIEAEGVTHQEIAEASGLSRSTVTGILSGSLQKVTIDRILKIVEALRLNVEVKLKKVA